MCPATCSCAFLAGIHCYVWASQCCQCQDPAPLGVEAAHDVPLQAGIDLPRHKPQLWTEAVALIPLSCTKDAHQPFLLGMDGALHISLLAILLISCLTMTAFLSFADLGICPPCLFWSGNVYIVHLGMLWRIVQTFCHSRWHVG